MIHFFSLFYFLMLPSCRNSLFHHLTHSRVKLTEMRLSRSISTPRDTTRVVILGSGAVGLLYGGRLLEAQLHRNANLDIHFIMRRDFQHCSSYGFSLLSEDGNVTFNPQDLHGRLHRNASTVNQYFDADNASSSVDIDWIICSLKSYALLGDSGEAIKLEMSKLVGPKTKILVLMNGLECEDVFTRWFDPGNVFGAMAFVCVNRLQPSSHRPLLVDHIAYGGLHIGHFEDNPTSLQEAANLWNDTTISHKTSTAKCLLQARWSKLAWNLPFNGLGVALGGITTDVIAQDPELRCLADCIMVDTIQAANADISRSLKQRGLSGPDIKANLLDLDKVRTTCWNLTDNMGPYRASTVLDLINGNDLEVDFMFKKPLERILSLSKVDVTMEAREDLKNVDAEPLEPLPAKSSYPYVESIIRQVIAVDSIARIRKARAASEKMPYDWQPTLMN